MHDDKDDTGGAFTLQEQIWVGGNGEDNIEGHEVLVGIKVDFGNSLLEQDEPGELAPVMAEAVDTAVYVYAKAEGDGGEKVDGDGQGDADIGTRIAATNLGGKPDQEYPGNSNGVDGCNTNSVSKIDQHSSSSITTSKTHAQVRIATCQSPLPSRTHPRNPSPHPNSPHPHHHQALRPSPLVTLTITITTTPSTVPLSPLRFMPLPFRPHVRYETHQNNQGNPVSDEGSGQRDRGEANPH